MTRLKYIKDTLIDAVCAETNNLAKANTKELGEVIDMIKDISETMYYCSIVKAMEEGKEIKNGWSDEYESYTMTKTESHNHPQQPTT